MREPRSSGSRSRHWKSASEFMSWSRCKLVDGVPDRVVFCRITELESKIGAGLLEEVIQVAEGELRLVETMARHKV